MAIRSGPARVGRCLFLVAALAAAAVGCASESPDAGPTADDTVAKRTSSTTTGSTTTTTEDATTTTTTAPKPTPKDEVEAAYLEIVKTYYDRLLDPNPDDPTIAAFHTGKSLQEALKQNKALRDAGAAGRYTTQGRPLPTVISIAIEGDSAVVRNCLVDDVVIFNRATDNVLNDEVTSRLTRSQMKRIDGRWRLAEQQLVASWPDSAGCER